MGRIDADVEVRNFQGLTNWLADTMSESEAKGMQAGARCSNWPTWTFGKSTRQRQNESIFVL